jgi:hypothetical protein
MAEADDALAKLPQNIDVRKLCFATIHECES